MAYYLTGVQRLQDSVFLFWQEALYCGERPFATTGITGTIMQRPPVLETSCSHWSILDSHAGVVFALRFLEKSRKLGPAFFEGPVPYGQAAEQGPSWVA